MRFVQWSRVSALSLLLAAAACGGSSPSAPSSTTSSTTATPAVSTLSLTGTWMLGNVPAFTITQNGTAISGTQIFQPLSGSGVVITQSGPVSGTLTGTASGSTLNLTLTTTIVTVGTGSLAGFAVSCVSTDHWSGQATNTSLVGTYTSGAFTCDGIGGVTVPTVTGPQNYTKQ
jgi:hypothetical protein